MAEESAFAWYPRDYCDETVPDSRESAQAWIERHGDGWRVAPLEPNNPESFHLGMLTDGDSVVFMSREDLGSATLTVAEDGTWSVDRDPPPEANTVNCEINLSIAESLSAVVADLKGMECFDPGESYHLDYSAWTPHTYRFDAATGTLNAEAATH